MFLLLGTGLGSSKGDTHQDWTAWSSEMCSGYTGASAVWEHGPTHSPGLVSGGMRARVRSAAASTQTLVRLASPAAPFPASSGTAVILRCQRRKPHVSVARSHLPTFCVRSQDMGALCRCRNALRNCFHLVKKSDTTNRRPLPLNQRIDVSKNKVPDAIPISSLSRVSFCWPFGIYYAK